MASSLNRFALLLVLLAVPLAPAWAQDPGLPEPVSPLDLATIAGSAAVRFCPDTRSHFAIDEERQRNEAVDPADPVITVRLSPALGARTGEIEAELARLENVRLADDADFELTVPFEDADQLVAVDARAPEREWRVSKVRTETSCGYRDPPATGIGRLDGDWRTSLRSWAGQVHRLREVLALLAIRPKSPIETCVGADGGYCRSGRYQQPGDDALPGEAGDADFASTGPDEFSVRNASAKRQFVRVLAIDTSHAISANPGLWLEPGQKTTLPFRAQADPGRVFVVTLSSGQEFGIDALLQGGDAPACSPTPQVPCDRPVAQLASEGRWQVDWKEILMRPANLARVGGGNSVLAGASEWMAQIYDSRGFSAAEIAADARRSRSEQSGLATMTAAQRDLRCGGAVIGPGLVLTAAHCVAEGSSFSGPAGWQKARKVLKVRTGGVALRSTGGFDISGIAIHAGFSPGRNPADIALIKLARAKTPVAIPLASRPVQSALLSIFGWGFTGQAAANPANPHLTITGSFQKPSETLLFAPMIVVPNCAARLVCAKSPPGRKREVFSCFKDSGGPLVHLGQDSVLVGIVNYARGCSGAEPTYFADVASYRAWIDAAAAWLAKNPGKTGQVAEPRPTAAR